MAPANEGPNLAPVIKKRYRQIPDGYFSIPVMVAVIGATKQSIYELDTVHNALGQDGVKLTKGKHGTAHKAVNDDKDHERNK